ncbi:MAG TPA: NAD+ synthase [Planctomycetota bacterium]|nr:NAD+ synthase [Planctomycetota bacterium]
MRIALCQIDTTVGDFAGNVRRIVDFATRAQAQGAQLAVFPELAVCGYPPEDLLLRTGFLRAHAQALRELAAAAPRGLHLLVGCLDANAAAAERGGRPLHNAVALLHDGTCEIVARKCLLPTYDVFDESRYFEPWKTPEANVVELHGRRIGIVVCEDGWNDELFFDQRTYAIDPVQRVVDAGAEIVVNLSASPWARGKESFRHRMVAAASARHGVPMLYVNMVGGDVELQFDGGSLALKPTGAAAQPIAFREALIVVDTEQPWTEAPLPQPTEALQHAAIVQGIAAYVRKFGFERVVVGLSGGIDSALTATLAVDALGPHNVAGIAMPSSYSSEHSLADARQLAENLGIAFHVLPIAPLQPVFAEVLQPVFGGTEPGFAEENLQARMRGTLLMAFANKHGHLVLTTGNKSECAVGYCTIYGDTNGALAPIADLWKTEVWALSRWLNRDRERIPRRSIEKPPSAELRPGQLDSDSLPPYPELDAVLRCLIEEGRTVEETAARTGMARARVAELFAKVHAAEWKRYQYPPTLKVSDRCWAGRRMPVAHRYREL